MNDFHSSSRHRYIGWLQSFQSFCPPSVGSYCAVNLDTIPKVMNHVLALLAASNFFLLFGSLHISYVTFLAAALLAAQTGAVIVVMNHDAISFAPRVLAPTEFMVGLCLGICIGGIILAFFLSITYRRMYAFCKYAETYYEEDDHEHACGSYTHRLWGIWMWSSVVFWLDLLAAVLVAAGHAELSHSPQQEYHAIGGNPAAEQPREPQYGNQFQQGSFQQQQDPRLSPPDLPPTRGYGDFAQPLGPSGGAGARIMPV
jgi:hypothetical protein